jgi:acyl carrier protein
VELENWWHDESGGMTIKDQSNDQSNGQNYDRQNSTDRNVATDPASDSAAGSAVRRCPEPANGSTPPQTTLQAVLLNVWVGVLGMEKIGVADDFFELGGDSVLATQVVSRLRDLFRMDLPPIVLFDAPTVEQLANYMIANEARPGLAEKTAAVLKRIEGMTDEEVTRSLRSR